MTAKALKVKKNSYISLLSPLLCLAIAFLMIILGENIKSGILDGLRFASQTIIPTLFPFFVLSDLWSSYFYVNENGFLGRLFERLFHIHPAALSAFLSGLICGFPIGVKTASELYLGQIISKDEFEHLSGFVNNPSVAFIISGVGMGIFGDLWLGVMLYFSVVLSSLAVGVIFRKGKVKYRNSSDISRQTFSLVQSVKNAGATSITVTSYIIFFSGLIGIYRSFIENEAALSLISTIFEVSSATSIIGNCSLFSIDLKLMLTAFALGFSGLSVHLQALSFFPEDASRTRYFLMKLIQGIISAFLMLRFAAFFH